jgi:rhodanese-related sulfurtransferase
MGIGCRGGVAHNNTRLKDRFNILKNPTQGGRAMKKAFALTCVLLFLFTLTTAAFAGKKPTPTTLEGGKIITAEDAKKHVGQRGVHFFDMRKALNYGRGHIPGAMSNPYQWTSKDDVEKRTGTYDMSRLPSDKSATIVFYSDGPTGWKSYKAATAAIKAGYKNVLYFRGGSAEWLEKGYPLEK